MRAPCGLRRVWLGIAAIVVVVACAGRAQAQAKAGLMLQSSAFADNSAIPSEYTCTGTNVSPPLSWRGAPDRAKAVALIVKDPDAPHGVFVHWLLYNLPADVDKLPANLPKAGIIPQGATQGTNSFGQLGYDGPCPPPGRAHHYHFRLIALDSRLDLGPGADAGEVEAAASGHILASTELVGVFSR